MYFIARWQPEVAADNGCWPVFDRGALEQARAYIDQANKQRDPSSHPTVQGYLLLNEARIFYAFCMSLPDTDDEYEASCARFENATKALTDLYAEQRTSALAPLVATAYAMHGDIAYLNADDRGAIALYEQALATDQSDLYQNVQVSGYLGDSYYQLGQLDKAAQAYDRASALAGKIPRPDWEADFAAARDSVDEQLQTSSITVTP